MIPVDGNLIDVHLHLQDGRLKNHQARILETLRKERVAWWGVNGTSPDDWSDVAFLAESNQEVFPFFGVHPWRVHTLEDSWEEELTGWLKKFPRSGVGEIGLDRWIRDHDLPRQREVFARQLDLAMIFQRPVAIHCLRAFGHLAEILEEKNWERPFLLHSYGGPREMVNSFLQRGAYFSISGYFFHEEKRKKLKVFESIPADRILLETDSPDMLPPERLRREALRIDSEGGEELNHPANLVAIYEAFAEWADLSFETVVQQMNSNCDRWINESTSHDSGVPDRP